MQFSKLMNLQGAVGITTKENNLLPAPPSPRAYAATGSPRSAGRRRGLRGRPGPTGFWLRQVFDHQDMWQTIPFCGRIRQIRSGAET